MPDFACLLQMEALKHSVDQRWPEVAEFWVTGQSLRVNHTLQQVSRLEDRENACHLGAVDIEICELGFGTE